MAHNEDGTGRVVDHVVAHRSAEETLKGALPRGADDDHVGVQLFGEVHDGRPRMLVGRNELDLDPVTNG